MKRALLTSTALALGMAFSAPAMAGGDPQGLDCSSSLLGNKTFGQLIASLDPDPNRGQSLKAEGLTGNPKTNAFYANMGEANQADLASCVNNSNQSGQIGNANAGPSD
jgi:hypothetical protein